VQFLERLVADDVRPQGVVRWPDGLVDQHGHAPILRPFTCARLVA
jgi:hypothetical protein